MRHLAHDLARFRPFLAPSDAGAGAAPADPAPGAGAAAPAGDGAPAPKWWEAADYSAEEREWLTAKGLAVDDPGAILPKLVKGHRLAEQRIGRGLDKIIDPPGEGRPFAEWARANAKALGLPEAEDGYAVDRPEGWPQDMPWNDDMAAQARKIAFDHGLHTDALKAFTGLYAGQVQKMNEAVDAQIAEAQTRMRADLEKEWGAAMPAKIALAQQGAKALAEAAGLGNDGLEVFAAALSPKLGDAAVMRMMAVVGGLMAEDSAPGLGQGGGLSMTPAEAQAELNRSFLSPDSAFYKAMKDGDRATLERLKPEYERLNRLAAQKK